MNIKNCLKCNKEFTKKITCSKKEWVTSKFCSKSCANSMNMIGRKNSLGAKPNKTSFKKGNIPHNYTGENPTLICKECGGYFKVKKYRENQAKFCSRLCKTNNSNLGKTPESKKIRSSLAYKAWRTLVFERDNYTCLHCGIKNEKGLGKTVYLHADHIKPFAMYPELRFDVLNGRTLCEECHKKTDTYGRGIMYRKNLLATGQEA